MNTIRLSATVNDLTANYEKHGCRVLVQINFEIENQHWSDKSEANEETIGSPCSSDDYTKHFFPMTRDLISRIDDVVNPGDRGREPKHTLGHGELMSLFNWNDYGRRGPDTPLDFHPITVYAGNQ